MNRREFFMGGAGVLASGAAWARRVDKAKLDRVGVMSLCLDPVLKTPAHPNEPARNLDILDFADMVAHRFGIHRLEFQQTDFASTEPDYFREFRRRILKAKSQVNQINVEFANLNVSARDPVIRQEAIDLTKSWIDHAAELGCPRVMVNQGNLPAELRPAAIRTLQTMSDYGRTKGVSITMEPRWRADAVNVPWEVLVDVVKGSGTHLNPDCGNFPDNQSRLAALRVMYGLTAGSSHVKHFPGKLEAPEAIRLSREVGYKGIYTIEERGYNGSDPYAGVQTVLQIILANI